MGKTLTRREELAHTLLLILCAVIWGSAFVAQSIGAEFVGPFTFISMRSLLGAAALLPVIGVTSALKKKKNGGAVMSADEKKYQTLIL